MPQTITCREHFVGSTRVQFDELLADQAIRQNNGRRICRNLDGIMNSHRHFRTLQLRQTHRLNAANPDTAEPDFRSLRQAIDARESRRDIISDATAAKRSLS